MGCLLVRIRDGLLVWGTDWTIGNFSDEVSATCSAVSDAKLSVCVNHSIDKRVNGHSALSI